MKKALVKFISEATQNLTINLFSQTSTVDDKNKTKMVFLKWIEPIQP